MGSEPLGELCLFHPTGTCYRLTNPPHFLEPSSCQTISSIRQETKEGWGRLGLEPKPLHGPKILFATVSHAFGPHTEVGHIPLCRIFLVKTSPLCIFRNPQWILRHMGYNQYICWGGNITTIGL